MIGSENLLYSLNQSGEKLNLITTWSRAFSRALGSWVFSSLLIGLFLIIWFGFMTFNRGALYHNSNQGFFLLSHSCQWFM